MSEPDPTPQPQPDLAARVERLEDQGRSNALPAWLRKPAAIVTLLVALAALIAVPYNCYTAVRDERRAGAVTDVRQDPTLEVTYDPAKSRIGFAFALTVDNKGGEDDSLTLVEARLTPRSLAYKPAGDPEVLGASVLLDRGSFVAKDRTGIESDRIRVPKGELGTHSCAVGELLKDADRDRLRAEQEWGLHISLEGKGKTHSFRYCFEVDKEDFEHLFVRGRSKLYRTAACKE
jgi:hypothetical protein